MPGPPHDLRFQHREHVRILALNFGHDASLALFENGRLVEFEELERLSRLKRHVGMATAYVRRFLNRCDLSFSQVDLVALCSSQQWSLAHDDGIVLSRGCVESHGVLSTIERDWDRQAYWESTWVNPGFARSGIERQRLGNISPSAGRTTFTFPFLQGPRVDSSQLSQLVSTATRLSTPQHRDILSDFVCPYGIQIDSVEKPAFYVDHHACHAHYARFYSGNSSSIICTHDGGSAWVPFNSGGIYLSLADLGVVPLVSHRLQLGQLYDKIAVAIGLHGDAGKLMGLASYGRPSAQIVDLFDDCLDAFESATPEAIDGITRKVLAISATDQEVRSDLLRALRVDLPDPSLAAQAAANTQALTQQLFVSVVGGIARTIRDSLPTISYLDVTGGFALNCPSNSLLQQACSAIAVNPLPGAGDSGLAVGAGVLLNDLLGIAVHRHVETCGTTAAFPPSRIAYRESGSSVDQLNHFCLPDEEIPAFIADRLIVGDVLCIHRGRSEVGPRALGHRSIVAHAVNPEIRDRINVRKGRELWRPLAPLCRREDYSQYFSGTAEMGRFMLFTVPVLDSGIPAVTHVDGSARVQCVDETDVWLHPALGLLKEAGHHPVIINTSFNTSGEPIVETLDHAISSFLRMGFEFLVTETGIFSPRGVQ